MNKNTDIFKYEYKTDVPHSGFIQTFN
jgi:hypothetical protein